MEPKITTLKELVGKLIVARIPALDQENLSFVRLLRLEPAGIWIESHRFNVEMLERFDMPLSSTTLIQFIPFSGVEYIISSVSSITLSEAAFGLGD